MALDFVAGFLGGCAGIVVGHPLDTIKVHIQTQDHRNPKYRGTWHCFRTLLAQHSVKGLYRGVSSPMMGVAVVNAIVFGVYSQAQKYLNLDQNAVPATDEEDDEETKERKKQYQKHQQALAGYFLCGVSAGLAQSPVCSPMELAKTRVQLQSSTPALGPLKCLYRIHKSEGLRRGVFRGLGTTLLREAPSYGVYFATYEMLTHTASDEPIPTWQILMAGGFAGCASWVMTYPIDVVKSRLQADSRYSGPVDCFRQSIRTEGWSCMFRGLSSTIIRAFPTNAATFAVVTWTMRLFGENSNAKEAKSSLPPLHDSTAMDDSMKLARTSEAPKNQSNGDEKLKSINKNRETIIYRPQHQQQPIVTNMFSVSQRHMSTTSGPHSMDVGTSVQIDNHHHHHRNFIQNRHFDEGHHFEWTQIIHH